MKLAQTMTCLAHGHVVRQYSLVQHMALEVKCVLRLQKAQQCLLENAAANGWTVYNRLSLRNCKYLSANQCQCFLLSHMAHGPPEGTQPISHHPALAHHTMGWRGSGFSEHEEPRGFLAFCGLWNVPHRLQLTNIL